MANKYKAALNSCYYYIKPLIPRYYQVLLRRIYVNGLRLYYPHWPIMKDAVVIPKGWRGWPDGRKFAFILTHDVETDLGQSRCLRLMELEKQHGFLSSFNFVPERYAVSESVRNEIERNGFEVGVHDLRHDGKLYASKDAFIESAARINDYLKSWNSVGFRSGSMHHNLEWLHNLDIEYDASTFDFDPFEPQSDGAKTIFPIWIRNEHSGCGYMELPYTLPQDFTVFISLRDKNIDVWKKKLDWVASHGGMVLLITHPDYMNFDERKHHYQEYPIRFYTDLLGYVKTRYPGQYWNVPPREIARRLKDNLSAE